MHRPGGTKKVARPGGTTSNKGERPKSVRTKIQNHRRENPNITPHTAWVKTFGKQPRLLGNSGASFVPNPLIYRADPLASGISSRINPHGNQDHAFVF